MEPKGTEEAEPDSLQQGTPQGTRREYAEPITIDHHVFDQPTGETHRRMSIESEDYRQLRYKPAHLLPPCQWPTSVHSAPIPVPLHWQDEVTHWRTSR